MPEPIVTVMLKQFAPLAFDHCAASCNVISLRSPSRTLRRHITGHGWASRYENSPQRKRPATDRAEIANKTFAETPTPKHAVTSGVISIRARKTTELVNLGTSPAH